MLKNIILLLPFIVGMIVMAVMCAQKHKTFAQYVLVTFAFIISVYFLCDALVIMEETGERLSSLAHIGSAFLGPTLSFILLLYLWTLNTCNQHFGILMGLLYLFPLSFGFVELAAYGLMGVDRAFDYLASGRVLPTGLSEAEALTYHFFDVVTRDIYVTLVLVGVLFVSGFSLRMLWNTGFSIKRLYRFLFRGSYIRPMHLQILMASVILVLAIFRQVLGRQYLVDHDGFCIFVYSCVTLMFAGFGWTGVRLKDTVMYLNRPTVPPAYDDIPVSISKSQAMSLADDVDELTDADETDERNIKLRNDLHALMRDKMCFLYPGMSIYSVASQLGISRAEVNRLVMLFYGVNYEQYVRIQKVNYFIRYRNDHPGRTLKDYAAACNFRSVTSLNHQYKEITGGGKQDPFWNSAKDRLN